jgi:hypothetical protein
MSDVTLMVNEQTFKEVFNKIYPSVTLPFDGSTSLGPLWIGVDAEVFILGAGDIDFEDGNTFLLSELDIGWKKLVLRFGIDLPTIKIGGFCLFRMPEDSFILPGECVVWFPGGELFGGAPDIGPVKMNLNAIIPFVVTEISGRYKIGIRKDKNYQKVYADPVAIDVDPISINDTFGQLPLIVQLGVADATAQILSLVPQAWMVDVVLGFLGVPTVSEYVLNLLDIHDDVEEWLMDTLNVSIGVDNLLYQVIFDAMLEREELFKVEDPFEFVGENTKAVTADFGGFAVQPAQPAFVQPAIAAPLTNAKAEFDDDNLTITFDFDM